MSTIIFVVETNKEAEIDSLYIISTLKLYHAGAFRFRYVYLDSKNKYNKPKAIKKIRDEQKKDHDHVVVYCIDLDDFAVNPATQQINADIESYCHANGYEYVWFCRTIEEVYWGKIVPDSEKKRYAAMIGKKNAITLKDVPRLSKTYQKPKQSNLCCVLNKYLALKK